MRSEWRDFLDRLDHPVEFLHRDELEERFGITDVQLPAVFTKRMDGEVEHWIEAETINAVKSLDELKQLIEVRSVELA